MLSVPWLSQEQVLSAGTLLCFVPFRLCTDHCVLVGTEMEPVQLCMMHSTDRSCLLARYGTLTTEPRQSSSDLYHMTPQDSHRERLEEDPATGRGCGAFRAGQPVWLPPPAAAAGGESANEADS